MAKDISFQLDISGAGEQILQSMALQTAKIAAQAMAARASGMVATMDDDPPSFEVYTSVGVIKRGQRAIATIKANTNNPRQRYVAHEALLKSKDAGRLN